MTPVDDIGLERAIQSHGSTVRAVRLGWLFRRPGEMRVVAGLPLAAAAVYAVLFPIALWCYPALWHQAPVLQSDSFSYMRAAADLEDARLDHLQPRPPGY